ncbi:MAG: hypothetical protein ABH875_00035 [Candidatus Omnitrophota bacterium]
MRYVTDRVNAIRTAAAITLTASMIFTGTPCMAQAGVEKQYYLNGNVKLSTTYNKRHEKHGIENLYYETGELWSKTIYKRDRKDSIEKIYYKSGQIMKEKPYIKGVLNGTEKAYWENGELMEEMSYDDGMKDGVAKYYDIDGSLMEEKVWQQNELIETREAGREK